MKGKLMAVILLLGMLATGSALAQEAADLTGQCILGGNAAKKLNAVTDGNYKTYWQSQGGASGSLTVQLPEGVRAHSIYVKWYNSVNPCQVMEPDGKKWKPVTQSGGDYLAEYISFPKGLESFRLAPAKGVKGRMYISEIRVFGEGEPPAWVQRWQKPAAKADLLVVVAHPDDEVLFMGGAIPYYAGEMKKTVQVAYMTKSMPYRRLELLDGLWLCGVRNYPDIGAKRDAFANTLKQMYSIWGKSDTVRHLVRLYRQYRPEVALTHDLNGEYGHGAHRATADAAILALEKAADAQAYKKSAQKWGTWEVPKLYIHLYDRNVVDMDWRRPLEAFEGKTAFEMAQEAFQCHVSQQKTDYKVEDFGPYDNSLFGLYRSLVGPDGGEADFFANIGVN